MIVNEQTQEILFDLVCKYLKITRAELEQRIINNPEVANKEWELRKDNNDYYMNTETNIIGLAGFNTAERLDNIVFPIRNYRFESVLDYGAGLGILSNILSIHNKRVYYYDLPSKTQDFAKYLGQFNGNKVIHLEENDVFTRKYDLVICMDLFEHIEDPIGLLKQMIDSLEVGGRIITSGLYFSEQPMHLESNRDKLKDFNDYLHSTCGMQFFYSNKYETIMMMVKK